jgi:hypothetical protein
MVWYCTVVVQQNIDSSSYSRQGEKRLYRGKKLKKGTPMYVIVP